MINKLTEEELQFVAGLDMLFQEENDTSGRTGKCCFCGKEFKGYGHDPRPIAIIGQEKPRCCAECNLRIVNATRAAVWGVEAELQKALKLACEELIKYQEFKNENERHYALYENFNAFLSMAKKEGEK